MCRVNVESSSVRKGTENVLCTLVTAFLPWKLLNAFLWLFRLSLCFPSEAWCGPWCEEIMFSTKNEKPASATLLHTRSYGDSVWMHCCVLMKGLVVFSPRQQWVSFTSGSGRELPEEHREMQEVRLLLSTLTRCMCVSVLMHRLI